MNTAGIHTADARGITFDAPVPKGRHGSGSRADPTPDAAVHAGRARLATDEAKRLYQTRASTAERVHADARTHRALTTIPVRGLPTIHTSVLGIALAHNMMRALAIIPHLMTQAIQPSAAAHATRPAGSPIATLIDGTRPDRRVTIRCRPILQALQACQRPRGSPQGLRYVWFRNAL